MGNNVLVWRLGASSEDGLMEQIASEGETMNEVSHRLPGGGYTTFRTFGQNKVMRMEDHFRRLEETAELAGAPARLDREQVRAGLRQALSESGYEQARVRIIVDLEVETGMVYLLVEPLRIPSGEDYQQGVAAVTRTMQRQNPKAKLTQFIEISSVVRKETPPGINEVLMVDKDGLVLEGLSSNFFGVKGGAVYTAEEGVLAGITRSLVLEEAAAQGIPVLFQGVRASELDRLDEAFITSASRAVLPVVQVNGQAVGSGKPGKITERLLKGYLERVEAALEEV
jgi:branched-chain amino acid aminotransferase